MKNTILPVLLIMLGAVAPVSAIPLVGAELAKFSVLAGGYAVYGAGARFSNEVGAVSYITPGADSKSAGDRVNTAGVTAALRELAAAQQALTNMGTGTALDATMAGNVTLAPGVYSASALTTAAGTVLTLDGGGADNPIWVFNIPTYLVTGASTKIELVNAGPNASVVWNTGGYFTTGAGTSFIGTVMSSAYISQGADTLFHCGNLFSASYVTMGAGSHLTSTNCLRNANWAGAESGLGAGLDIVDGAASARRAPAVTEPAPAAPLNQPLAASLHEPAAVVPVPVPEPGTLPMLLLGLGLIGMLGMSRKEALRRTAHNACSRKTLEPV